MTTFTIRVFEDQGRLVADTDVIDACPQDSVDLLNESSRPVEAKFCLDGERGETLSCAAEHGPVPPRQRISGLEIPHGDGSLTVNALHVTFGDEYPKIMIRPGNCSGGG